MKKIVLLFMALLFSACKLKQNPSNLLYKDQVIKYAPGE